MPDDKSSGKGAIAIYYRDDMVPADAPGNYSKSPSKPRRFMAFLRGTPIWPHVELRDNFGPVSRDDLLLAHKPEYVNSFLAGAPKRYAESNGLKWSPEFRDSVLLTNGCLLAAITAAVDNPKQVTMAPVSGFHHAQPEHGNGFCTFSGQVIAALRLYRERGLRGAWVDLDGHFGNSIEDSRKFAPDLNIAIQPELNINPEGRHEDYLNDLRRKLGDLRGAAANGLVDYVCVAHGADSHEWDQLGSQCTTEEWLEASRMTYGILRDLNLNMMPWSPKPVGITLCLFGGYRDDHPESVLGLHAMDTALCLKWLGGVDLDYAAEVRPRRR